MSSACLRKDREEGHQICLEMVEGNPSGVQGIHFMAITDNTALKRLITDPTCTAKRKPLGFA